MVNIRIHFRNGSVIEVERPDMPSAYEFVRERISYSNGRVRWVYISYDNGMYCRCVHNEGWTPTSNIVAKQCPP